MPTDLATSPPQTEFDCLVFIGRFQPPHLGPEGPSGYVRRSAFP